MPDVIDEATSPRHRKPIHPLSLLIRKVHVGKIEVWEGRVIYVRSLLGAGIRS